MFGILNFGLCDLPFDLTQGSESLDFAQDREPVERLAEPFGMCDLLFEIFNYLYETFKSSRGQSGELCSNLPKCLIPRQKTMLTMKLLAASGRGIKAD